MYNLINKAAAALLVLLVVGCSQQNPSASNVRSVSSVATEPALQIVAVDLVSVLGQLPRFDPWSITVQVSPVKTSFGASVVEALRDAGYGVQRVSADQGINNLSYEQTVFDNKAKPAARFHIDVGGVRIARDYIKRANRWIPNSAMRVFGVKPTRVLLHNELHSSNDEATAFATGVVFYDEAGNIVESRTSVTQVSRTDSGTTGQAIVAQRALLLSQAATFSRQRAIASADRRSFQPIAEVVLRFPSTNPSNLGEVNKRAIAALLTRARSAADRFSIQGCSHGRSLIWDGTESLSLERQQRVNKELLVSGVDPAAIRESGCFSTDPNFEIPRQSVRLILERAEKPL